MQAESRNRQKSGIAKKRLFAPSEEPSLSHRLNVLKTLYDCNSGSKAVEETVLKKRDSEDFVEEHRAVDRSLLTGLAVQVRCLVPPAPRRHSPLPRTASFAQALRSAITTLPNSDMNDEFLSLSALVLRLGTPSVEFFVEAVALNVQGRPARLVGLNKWLAHFHRSLPEQFETVLGLVVAKLARLDLADFSREASLFWDDFAMVG